MIRSTYIARVADGLVLVASIGDDGHQSDEAKQIVRSLSATSPKRCTFESGDHSFHYAIDAAGGVDVLYLINVDKAYPKQLSFLFLNELGSAFKAYLESELGRDWERALATVDRPYAYIGFDRSVRNLTRTYQDPNSRESTSKLSNDLGEIQSIMKRSIADVLARGERLDQASASSSKLVNDSRNFHFGAKKLNRLAWLRKVAPFAVGGLVVFFFLFLRFYLLV